MARDRRRVHPVSASSRPKALSARIWIFLSKNWQPITSVSALVVSVASLFLGMWQASENAKSAQQSAELAKQGIELTREARAAEDEASTKDDMVRASEERARIIAMAPYLLLQRDLSSRSLIIANYGLGPAFIYQADYFAAGKTFTFKFDDIDPDVSLSAFIEIAGSLYDSSSALSEPEPTASVNAPISAGQNIRILSFGSSYKDENGKKFLAWAQKIGMRFCYTNLVSTHKGVVENLPPGITPAECPDPPDIVTTNFD